MPRRRFQQGCIRIVGDQWVLYFYRDEIRDGVRQRVKVSKRIGHTALSRRQARKLAQPIMDEANNQSEIPVREIKNEMTLAEYIPEFLRAGMIDLKPSTRRSMESSIRAHVIPVLGEKSLSAILSHAFETRYRKRSLSGRQVYGDESERISIMARSH